MKNSIVLKSLELAGFQNPTAIAEIISYVPNPSAALEMLLGVYEPTQIEPTKRFKTHRYSSHKEIAEIIDYDDLGNKVYYKVYEPKMQNIYFLTKEDKEKNIFTTDRPKGDYHSWNTIQASGYTERELDTSIEAFNDNFKDIMPIELAFAKLEEWDNYGVIIEKDLTDLYNAELV